MKKIAQMKKDELLEVARRFEVEVEPTMTKEEIKNAIEDANVTDDSLANEAVESVPTDEPAETEDEVIVRMIQKTSYYQYGPYSFTKSDPFAIMKKKDAERLLENKPTLFRKASQDDLRRFFR